MEPAQQMKRDLITVAVVVVLLVAALLLISSSAAFAQTATADQYSSATSDQHASDTATPTPPSATDSPSATSDQYSGASGSTASSTAPATATPTVTASPPASAPAPVAPTGDSSDTQSGVDALQSVLQTIANLGTSSGTISSCNPFGAYGGLIGWPAGCGVGPDPTNTAEHGGAIGTNGDSGSFTIQGYPYVPPAMPLGPTGLPAELLRCLLPQGCPVSTPPSSDGWQWIDPSQLGGLFPNLLDPIVSPDRPDTDGVDDDLDGSDQDGSYDEDN